MIPVLDECVEISSRVDRHNARIFIWMELLLYFTAPVFYVGVVQAAFCDRLGANATIANLPFASYLFGGVVPIFCAWLVPAKSERRVMTGTFVVSAVSMLAVCLTVFLPTPVWLRIAAVIGEGLLMGIVSTVTNTYMFKCLARGTTEAGRAKALKYGFGFGPAAAVAGSLLAQAVLTDSLPALRYPYTFGVLYLVAFPCMMVCAWLGGRFQLQPAPREQRIPLTLYLADCGRAFACDRRLAAACIGFFLWYVALGTMTNLTLFTKVAIGRPPLELAGLLMALRFGCKAIAGFCVGSFALRHGPRAAMLVTVVLVGIGAGFPFLVSGPFYLAAFGLMGAGELGGAYFSNYVISISSPLTTTRNLALLSLVGPISGVGLTLHGRLSDLFGFNASFLFGTLSAAVAVVVILAMTVKSKGGMMGQSVS